MRRRRRVPAAPQAGAADLLHFLAAGPATLADGGEYEYRLVTAHGARRVAASRLADLQASDLIVRADNRIMLSETGRARLMRMTAAAEPFLTQHGGIARAPRSDDVGAEFLHEAESPLAWLARRRGRDGLPLISASQFAAGERLRADFTRAGLSPRVTANWIAPVAQGRRSASPATFTEATVAAKSRLDRALAAAGKEFAGLLLDVCCFLKGLETVERERGWPPRTGKVVLGLALDRLASHYGIAAEARGPSGARMRAWQAERARPMIDGG
jgi:hypothetical protein